MSKRDEVLAALLEAKGLASDVGGGRRNHEHAIAIEAAIDTAIAYLRHPARFQAGHRVKVAADVDLSANDRSARGTIRKVSPNGYVIVDFDPAHVGPKEAMLTPARAAVALEVVVGEDAFPRHDWAAKALDGQPSRATPACCHCGVRQTDANEFSPCRRAPRAGTPHTLTVVRDVARLQISDHVIDSVVQEAGNTARVHGYQLMETPPDIRPHPRGGTAFLFQVELLPDAPSANGLPGGAR
jgi:hypothetical protein